MKSKILTLILLAISISSSFAQIPINGLVAYYPFTGNANDFSGFGNNGTVINATLTTDRFGNPNSAYYFNGTNAQINVPSIDTISNFPNGQSISFWMEISAYPSDLKEHYMIDKTDNRGSSTTTYYQAFISNFGSVNNVVYRYAESASISSQATAIPFASLPLNQWLHICFTTDLTTTKTYLDGKLFMTYVHYSPIGITADPLIFGNCSGTHATNAPYNGSLDDIRIYNRVLDSLEVKSLFNENLCYQSIAVTDTLIINENITGFNPITYSNTIKIYPNPTNDEITINSGTTGTNNGYAVKILNILNQVVYSQVISSPAYTISLSSFGGKGTYFIELFDTQSNLIDIRKIILQ